MRQLAFVSGKGGTGKTSLAASMARLFRAAVSVDCDVDAANLALLLPGEDGPAHPFDSGQRAVLDSTQCTRCGACVDACRFGALRPAEDGIPEFELLACEGCRACSLVCPPGAFGFSSNRAGQWWVRRTAAGALVHAELGVAQDNSGKLVAKVREVARQEAEARGYEVVLVDGPPGIGCPVHAALTGCDAAVAVVEPTVSAEHDLERLLALVDHFRIPVWVVINKHDLSHDGGARVSALCERSGVPVLARIPFDAAVPRLLAKGQPPLGAGPEVARAIELAYQEVCQRLSLQ
jgi:MinD superfamily P-loop ATPase